MELIQPEMAGLLGIVLLMFFLAVGVPIGFGAAIVGFLGILLLAGSGPALMTTATAPFSKIVSYTYSAIPLFVLMGYFAYGSGLGRDAFEVGKRWLGGIAGGLPIATVFSNAAFGACSGITVASAAIFGKVAVPEMERLGVSRTLAAGTVAASGTLAAMIPPSGVAVLYAIMVGTSVGKQLMAGLLPGVLMAALFAVSVYVRVKLNPAIGGQVMPSVTWKERFGVLPNLWGIVVLAIIIIGGIYSGIFSPTEAAAAGAFGALLLFIIRPKSVRTHTFRYVLVESTRTVGMMTIILSGILIFAHFIALSQLPGSIINWVGGLPVNRYVILAGILIIYFILGMFFETVGMLLLTLPFVIPIVTALNFDLVWFGTWVILNIEIGQITPPVGLCCFVVHSVCPQIPLKDVFIGIWPFVAMDLVAVALITIFPQIVMFLPNAMG